MKIRFQGLLQSQMNHCSFVTSSGIAYLWGKNRFGELGISSKVNTICTKPTALEFPNPTKVCFVTGGEFFSICLTEKNQLYVWGSNANSQLGLGDRNDRTIPTLLNFPTKEKIQFVACGRYHTICLTEGNQSYIWGYNYYGQLGLGDKVDRLIPTLFQLPKNEKYSFITCGCYHTMCITEDKLCYVWGWNYYGELGLGDAQQRLNPTLLTLPNNEKIFFIATGQCHSFFITENNLCYACGWNSYCQLGFSGTDALFIPTLLTLPNNEKITFISSKWNHSACLTENNLCYIWGWNDSGQLGLGDINNRSIPTLFSLPNNERISFITCGESHTFCLTENNLCYAWGKNTSGQLSKDIDKRFPIYDCPTLVKLPNH